MQINKYKDPIFNIGDKVKINEHTPVPYYWEWDEEHNVSKLILLQTRKKEDFEAVGVIRQIYESYYDGKIKFQYVVDWDDNGNNLHNAWWKEKHLIKIN